MNINKKKFFRSYALIIALTWSGLCPAPVFLNIWNLPSKVEGNDSWIDATTLASQLTFSNLQLFADSGITLLDNIDLSTSFWGPATGDLILNSPTVNLDFDMKMGSGQLKILGDTLNLGGKVLNSDDSLRDLTGFDTSATGATTVNVNGDTASIQQGIDLSNDTNPVTVNVTTGTYAEDVSVHKSITANLDTSTTTNVQSLSIGGATAATLTLNNATLNATSGTTIASNGQLTGDAQLTGAVHNDGAIFTNTAATRTFSGAYSGAGSLTGTGKIVFEGGLFPGNSPALITAAGDIEFAATNLTQMELGGTLRGLEYDAIDVADTLTLGGVLDIDFINDFTIGYTASDGDIFTLFNASLIEGDFSSILFPDLDEGLFWDITRTSSSYSAFVFSSVPIPGALWLMFSGIVSLFISARRKQ